MLTNEQIVDDLTALIELHEERVSRGAVHGARDLAGSVLTLLRAAGRLIPEGAEVPEVVQAVNSRSDEFVRDQIRSRRGGVA